MLEHMPLLTLCMSWLLLAAVPLHAQEQPVFDVPRLDGIVIDGRGDDWGDNGFRVEIVEGRDGVYLPADDLDVAFRLGWDARGLLLLLKVADDVPIEHPGVEESWREDCVQLFFADKRGGANMVFAFISPGVDPNYPELRTHLTDRRRDEELNKQPPTLEAARTKTDTGYLLEVLLPWSNLGVKPEVGREVGFQLYVDESDGPGTDFAVHWFPLADTAFYTENMNRIRLSNAPSPPVLATASGTYERFRRTKIAVTAVTEFIGQQIAIRMGDVELAKGRMADKNGRASYTAEFPMPAYGTSYGPLDVVIDDKRVGVVNLPGDIAEQRARAFIDAQLRSEPPVFSSPRFPSFEFTQPSRVEDLIGRYAIKTTFYDKDYNEVKSADEPGRYGAVIEITSDSGSTFHRCRTLYRMPQEVHWLKAWRGKMTATIDLFDEYGIDPRVVNAQSHVLGKYLKDQLFYGSLSRDPWLGALLAGLAETDPSAAPAGVADDVFARDQQWWVGLKRKLYGLDKRYPDPFVCPRPIAGKPAPVLRDGTVAEAGMKADAVEKIDAACQTWLAEGGEAFGVCLARHGVVFFHKAYGTRDGQPMTVTTPSWMMSITKLMSGTLLMMLVDQGLVDLDDRVDEYLPPFRGVEVETPLTIRHLYTHTNGLWDHWGDTMNDLEHVIAGYYPYLEIGKRYEYNGVGFALGGKVIELMSGEVLARFYKNHLLEPLKCAHTEVSNAYGDAESIPLEMARIGQMLLNKGAYGDMRFLSEETFEQMLPQRLTKVLGDQTLDEYGIGTIWYKKEILGEGTFGHGAASCAVLRIDPENDLIIVVTRNMAGKEFEKHKELFFKAILDSLGE